MEFDDIEPIFEEFERNQLVNDREHDLDGETPLGYAIEEGGELID